MRSAGIREARQNLSKLLAEVAQGEEITITDRGKPVARLVRPRVRKGFPDHSAFRQSMPRLDFSIADAIAEEREDRF
ncbi:MAG: type II toxin-antitoxin system Phd/YefM family antitoxin [Terriglobales bacterium]